MDERQIKPLFFKWNFLNQLVENEVSYLENVCLDCRRFLRSIRRPPINTLVETNSDINDNKNLVIEKTYDDLKIVDEVLNKAEKIRSNVYFKPRDNLNDELSKLSINDFNIKVGSNILNDKFDEKITAKEIFPSIKVLAKNHGAESVSKILVINNNSSKAKQYKTNAFKKDKTYIVKSNNANLNQNNGSTSVSKMPYKHSKVNLTSKTQSNKSNITLIKSKTSMNKIDIITESIKKSAIVSAKKESELCTNINYCSNNENFLQNLDDFNLYNNNINESNKINDYICKNEIFNEDINLAKNAEVPNVATNDNNQIFKESFNNDIRKRIKEIRILNKKLSKNEELRNKIESNFQLLNGFASLLEQTNDNILNEISDEDAYYYKRCQFYSICKLAILDATKGSNLKEIVIASRQILNKISSDIVKIDSQKLKDNYCQNNLDDILDNFFIYSDNKKSFKYSNFKQVKEYLNTSQSLCSLKLRLILLNSVENYILQILNKININQVLFLKCYQTAYSLVCSFGCSFPTLLYDLQENNINEEISQNS